MPVCGKPHSCRSCHKRFADENRLEKHLSRVHGSEEFKSIQCNICEKRFLNNSALGSHLRTHNGHGSLWECSICKETYGNRDGLKGHVASHSIDGSFACPLCQKVFSGYLNIRKHIVKVHRSSGVRCSLCDFFCSSTQKYEKHMLRHSSQKQVSCKHCEKQFKRRDKLRQHVRRVHGCDPSEETPNKQDEKTLEKKKSTEKRIERKLQDLNEQYLFKCEPCLIGFKRRGMLVNHIAKYHPNITPDEIPELNLPIVTTTRDFYCHLCEKVYKSNAKRKAHIIKFHPGVPKVEQLKRSPSFDQPAGTIAKKPEHCPWCHKQYATNAKLLQHLRSQHSDKSHFELRKRGRSQADKTHCGSKNEVENNLVTKSDESTNDELNSEGCSTDSFATEASVDEATDDEMSSSITGSVADAEVGMQLDPFMEEDDIDMDGVFSKNLLPVGNSTGECSEGLLFIERHVTSAGNFAFSEGESIIQEGSTLTEVSLSSEDEDDLMLDWFIDFQVGPSYPQTVIPITPKTFALNGDIEVDGILSDLPVMALADNDGYADSDYHLFDLNLPSNSTHLPPAQVFYTPYPPH